MRLKATVFVTIGMVILLMFVSGCSRNEVSTNIEAQKSVIDMYMEGLRDQNKDKILKSSTPDAAFAYQTNPESLNNIFNAQKALGRVKEWKLRGEPYVDEVNNQSLIDVTAVYPKTTYQLKFDLRRVSGKWGVQGVVTDDPLKSAKSKK